MTVNIVFDFGAVLFDWRPEVLVAKQFAERAGTEPLARALARDIFHHDDWQSFDRGTLELPLVIERTSRRLDLPQQALHGFLSSIAQWLTPIPDSVLLLQQLYARRARDGDIRLYFLSNMPAPFARVLESRHDFVRSFDGGVFSGDVKLIKPQAAIYSLLEERYQLQPDRTVFIDDLPGNVEAACVRGWSGIHFRSAAQLAQDLQRHIG